MTSHDRTRRALLAGAAALAALPTRTPDAMAETAAGLSGDWLGAVYANGAVLRLRLALLATGGAPDVTLFSLDQGGAPILATEVAADGVSLNLGFGAIGGRLSLSPFGADGLRGVWSQNGARQPIRFGRESAGGSATPAPRPPLTAEHLNALREEAGSPAFAAAAEGPAGPVTTKVGLRSASGGDPVSPYDAWHWGSIGKSMTATLAAMAVEAGLLSWDTTLGEVLGPALPDMRADFATASLTMLLSHRAGLPGDLAPTEALRYPATERDPRGSRLDYLSRIAVREPLAAPGAAFHYANSGYVAVGAMLEERLGAPWEQLMTERLFAPFGLLGAGFGPPAPFDRAPLGHRLSLLSRPEPSAPRRPFAPDAEGADNPAVLGPAGRVHMPLPDMLRYLSAHRDRAPMLSADSWDHLHRPPFDGSYALGWFVDADGALSHAGSNTLWYAIARVDPAAGTVAAAVANDGVLRYVSGPVGEALAAAADTASGRAEDA